MTQQKANPLKELDDNDIAQILSTMADHARKGRNPKCRDIVRNIMQSTQRRGQLKEDIRIKITAFNSFKKTKQSWLPMQTKIRNLRQARHRLEQARKLFDADRLIVRRLATVADEKSGNQQSLSWPAIRSRLTVMNKEDPGEAEDEFYKRLHDINPKFPPSEAAWTKVTEARQAIDVLVDGLRDLETQTIQRQANRMPGSHRTDEDRVAFVIELAEIFERHFVLPPRVSRNHLWHAFLAATLNSCEHRKKPLLIDGAYKLWLDVRKSEEWADKSAA